ncbi:MAG TPA: phosphotransferase family protein, partial [Acidimicrobiia bacterium]|nr:phosphotransferase family protein [Acidimicrobiia bacterium]
GLLLVYWGGPGGEVLPQTAALAGHTGFFSADEVVEEYAKASGRDVGHLDFHVVLAYYKLAIILEGIHARYLKGKTVGEGFDRLGGQVRFLAQAALDVAAASEIVALRG